MAIQIKRIYDAPARGDGYRVLVDRLWPRGMTREAAEVDLWLREVAPSGELRGWYGHDPTKWNEFLARYFRELDAKPEAIARLIEQAKEGKVTSLFGTRELKFNNATALRDYLVEKVKGYRRGKA
jgi:uncharacterized protein YeaO (DUF488 family)